MKKQLNGMKQKLDNAIIMNGKVHILVNDDMPNTCARCSLADRCGDPLLCDLFGHTLWERYEFVGYLMESVIDTGK